MSSKYAAQAAWQKRNPENHRESQRRYRERNAEKVREAERNRPHRAARAAYLREVKLQSGCLDCGYDDDPSRLHFDHRAGTIKEFEPSAGVDRSWERMLAEIAKCDVRCASCHGRRHAQEAS